MFLIFCSVPAVCGTACALRSLTGPDFPHQRKSTDTKVGAGKLGIATRDLLFAICSAKEISKADSTALRKIPQNECSSFFLCAGGMRHSVRFALADRPGLPPPTKKHRHKGRCFRWWGKLDSDQRSQ